MNAVFSFPCFMKSLYAREFKQCLMSQCLEWSPMVNSSRKVCVTGFQKHQLHTQHFQTLATEDGEWGKDSPLYPAPKPYYISKNISEF